MAGKPGAHSGRGGLGLQHKLSFFAPDEKEYENENEHGQGRRDVAGEAGSGTVTGL